MMRYTRQQPQHQQRQQQLHRLQQPAKHPNDVGLKQDDHCAEEDLNMNITMMTKTMTMITSKNE